MKRVHHRSDPMYSGVSRGFKGSSWRVKETASCEAVGGIVGPVELAVLEYCSYNGSRFKPVFVVDWAIERGLAPESARSKLLKRVHDAVRRLASRGFVKRVARGLYMLTASLEQLSSRLRPARIESIVGVKETGGTRVPAVRGVRGGGVVGVFLDNLRGYTGSGYVGGDRGAVRGFADLVFFERVSYSEFAVSLGTGFLEGLGQVVLYYGCKGVSGVGVVCGDWLEWRPAGGFVKGVGVLGARRVFVGRVVPVVLGLAGRAAVVANSPFKLVARYLYVLARSLYVYVKGRGAGGLALLSP